MFLIDKGLWQGGQVNALPEGTSAVINLDMDDFGTRFRDPDVARVWLPIIDGPFPGIPWLRMAVGILEAMRGADLTVYVHCYAGRSRSVMLVAAYLMKRYRWDVDSALDVINAENASSEPNPSFVAGLREWKEEMHARRITIS